MDGEHGGARSLDERTDSWRDADRRPSEVCRAGVEAHLLEVDGPGVLRTVAAHDREEVRLRGEQAQSRRDVRVARPDPRVEDRPGFHPRGQPRASEEAGRIRVVEARDLVRDAAHGGERAQPAGDHEGHVRAAMSRAYAGDRRHRE
jgi:hypothetical protein